MASTLVLVTSVLTGCSAFATPNPPRVHDSSLAPPGPVGYVVCPTSVTPVELATRTAEADIPLPIAGTPELGNFAIATSPDGRWAYVVTSNGARSSSTNPPKSALPVTTRTSTPKQAGAPAPAGVAVQNVVIPIDLVTQRAQTPIDIPGQGGTHAIVVVSGRHTVLASSGSTVVPVDTVARHVGAPIDFGSGHTVFGLASGPDGSVVYALVAGGVFAVNAAKFTAGTEIPTGMSVSSVYSPHGIVVTGDGTTVYVVGQGGSDYGGRVLPIVAASGITLRATGFDRFGIADPAAIAVAPDGSSLLVADSANDWVNPVPLASFSDPPLPVRLPPQPAGSSPSGTQHPTDIVAGPGRSGIFVVEGFGALVPFDAGSQTFGRPIPVCAGASSMAVASAP